MRIVLIGMKGCGKTTIGRLLAEKLQVAFFDADAEIETMHARERDEVLSFREIFRKYGETYFQALDSRTLAHIAQASDRQDFVFACGGRTPLRPENQAMLRGLGNIIFLNVAKSVLLQRTLAQGIPTFFPYPHDPERSLDKLLTERLPVYKQLADWVLDIGEEAPASVVHAILAELKDHDKN